MLNKKAYSPVGTWEAFVRALQIRFVSTAFDDLMEALTRLRQTSSTASFKGNLKHYQIGLRGCQNCTSCFLIGLKDEIRLLVRMLNPLNLNAALD